MSRALFILALVVSVLGEFSTGAYIPLTRLTGQMLSLDPDMLQPSIASFILTFGSAQILLGPLSDSIRCRPVVIGGLIVFVAGSIGGMRVDTRPGPSLARGVQGVGAASGYVVRRAMLR
ncbi:hypothetical protein [Jannaschia sp. CCS1]|uniref:hypothetical protein n=1 Tax=Jannaschia sp. (strain CCS1) TaxID=290400 RepID=UPI0005C75961|nr:hypothetical protein [Jannaschia sp. CCS1]